MSISILFLPVAIALSPVMLVARLVMGKEGFENFIKSGQYRVRTDFSSEAELSRAMKKSGHDLVHFGGMLKTHLEGESDFFFWEQVEGHWEAVFSRHDDAKRLRRFMERVEQAAGRLVFNRDTVPEADAPMLFTTGFKDTELLQKALRDFGANPRKTEAGDILCHAGKSELRFTQQTGQPFSVEIRDMPNAEEAQQQLAGIDEDYRRCVQTAVYEKVKARAESQGLMLESEEVLEDRTILMSLRVK
jgi:hypothetical protein